VSNDGFELKLKDPLGTKEENPREQMTLSKNYSSLYLTIHLSQLFGGQYTETHFDVNLSNICFI
jgi:hypothetical protein